MIRFRAEDESGAMKEWDVSCEEFERLISTGEADPDLEVYSDNLTQGQWKRLGETTLYKKAAAVREGGGSLGLRDVVERTHTPEPLMNSKGDTVWICGKCGRENIENMKFCLACSSPCSADAATTRTAATRTETSDSVPSRYQALRTIAGVCKVIAWLTAIVCVLVGLASIAAVQKMGGGGLGVLGALAYLVAGAIGFVGFYAAAESIIVFIDIEENTRATRLLTQRTLEAISRLAARPADRKD